jgi:drug/metabolite transporter (DMT)-like permease
MPAQAESPGPTFRGAGLVTLILTLLGWSSIPLFLRYFRDHIDFWTANGWRYGFSALLWAPALVLAYRRRTAPPGLWTAAIVPALFNTIGQVLFAWAPYIIDPGLMTFGMRMQIVFVAAGAAMLFPAERRIVRSPGFLLGLLIVTAGTIGTVFLGRGLPEATMGGAVVAVSSGLFFAGYALAVRKYMHGVNPLLAFAVISLYTAAAMVGLMLAFGRGQGATALEMGGGRLGLLLLSSLVGIGLGHTFYYISIARMGVAVSAGVIQLQPIIVALASLGLFGERLNALQWGAGSLAVLGAGLILYVQHRLGRPAPATAPGQVPEPEELAATPR